MKLRWGIVGLGKIAHKFADDLMLIDSCDLTSVASRQMEKAIDFGSKYNVSEHFDDYEALFKSESVDIVYIATPHHLHAELSVLAMKHGKHVLCEKPAALNPKELKWVLGAAEEYKRFYMEALWSRFNPSIHSVLAKIQRDAIGAIRYINADFCFQAKYDAESRLFNPDLAGGALYDIGLYPLFLSYAILGVPDEILASSNPANTGVDMQTAVICKYPSAHAVLYSAFDVNSKMEARIYGADGDIFISDRWHETSGYKIQTRSGASEHTLGRKGHGYVYEIQECVKCIRDGALQSALWSWNDSLCLAEMIDNVASQIKKA